MSEKRYALGIRRKSNGKQKPFGKLHARKPILKTAIRSQKDSSEDERFVLMEGKETTMIDETIEGSETKDSSNKLNDKESEKATEVSKEEDQIKTAGKQILRKRQIGSKTEKKLPKTVQPAKEGATTTKIKTVKASIEWTRPE